MFVGYRLIRGEPLVDEDADGVRAFLDALHAFDPSGLPVERPDWVEAYREQCAEFEHLVLSSTRTGTPRRRDSSPRRRLLWGSSRCCSTPTSVQSISSCVTAASSASSTGATRDGDPALDYAWLLNGPFADWEVDPDLRRRARFYHRLAPWYEAHYGLFTNQPAHVERGMAGIRDRL